MSLLTIMQEAMVLAGLDPPDTVIANTDPTVRQFKVLSKIVAEELVRDYEWPQLLARSTLTGDGTSTVYDLPLDFSRWVSGHVFYKSDNTGDIYRSVTTEQMNYIKQSNITPLYPVWTRFGDTLDFFPAVPLNEVIKAYYVSEYWAIDSALLNRSRDWAADDDYSVIQERLVTLGTVAKYMASRGFPSVSAFAEYTEAVRQAIGEHSGAENIDLSMPSEWSDGQPSFTVSAGS
jgi:hypothetical protein